MCSASPHFLTDGSARPRDLLRNQFRARLRHEIFGKQPPPILLRLTFTLTTSLYCNYILGRPDMLTRLAAACSSEASSSTAFVAIQHGCKRRKLPNRMPQPKGPARSFSQSTQDRLAAVTAAPSSSNPGSVGREPFSFQQAPPRATSKAQRGGFIKLPTPLPADVYSTTNEVFFTSSKLQMKLAIIDTCLHNHSDVDRARKVFDLLRSEKENPAPASIINTALHNRMLRAYFALSDGAKASNPWQKRAWTLYEDMVEGKSLAGPDASTFAIVLQAEA